MPKEDGSLSHGLFRIPGYLASLKSGKVKGDAQPKIEQNLDSVITVDGNLGYAPLSHEKGLPVLADAAQRSGIAVMRLSIVFILLLYGLRRNFWQKEA